MQRRLIAGGLFLAMALAPAACETVSDTSSSGAGAASPSACEPTIASISATIFSTSCVDALCHGAGEPAVGLDLASEGVEARLIERAAASCDHTLVVPSDPALSLLYRKITGPLPECGDAMPVGAPLEAAQIACIHDWIASLPPGCETCGGAGCADLAADPAHCGDCTIVCPLGATCSAGSCACGAGESACADACVDTTSDPDNCGSCGKTCPPVQVCSLSACKASCDAGLTKCGNACVDTESDAKNCGTCGRDCGTGTCIAGNCDCGPGIDPETDPNNCGACGNVCPPGQTCAAGACMCGSASVSFGASVQPIFTANCATNGCHRTPAPKERLNLMAGVAYDQIVDVAAEQCTARMRVAPGDPSESYLLDKLLGVDLCFGSMMPKSGSVSTADIETISNWICAGAPND